MYELLFSSDPMDSLRFIVSCSQIILIVILISVLCSIFIMLTISNDVESVIVGISSAFTTFFEFFLKKMIQLINISFSIFTERKKSFKYCWKWTFLRFSMYGLCDFLSLSFIFTSNATLSKASKCSLITVHQPFSLLTSHFYFK